MKQLLRAALAGSIVIGSVTVGIGNAQAGTSCHKIDAVGVGHATSPTTTVADISDGGLLNGTTAGSFTSYVDENFPPLVGLAGTVVFTVNKATLTVAGTDAYLDVTDGSFTVTWPVTASTGKLAGATGSLTFDGVQDLTTGYFTETVTGTICVAVSQSQ